MSNALARGEHGVTSYRLGCRCPVCVRALRRRAKVWNATVTARRGAEPATHVPTRRVRAHVHALRAAGMTQRTIADAAGVAQQTISRVLVAGQCSRIVERLVLAVPAPAP